MAEPQEPKEPIAFKEMVADFFRRDLFSKSQNHHTLADLRNKIQEETQNESKK